MTPIRLVTVDVDGTLLSDGGEVGGRTARRIAEAQARGVGVVLVTGRPFAAVRRHALALGVRLPVVCCNGAVVREPVSGRLRFRRGLGRALAAEVAAGLAGSGLHACAVCGRTLLGPHLDPEAGAFYAAHGLRVVPVADLAEALGGRRTGPDMIVVRGEPSLVGLAAESVRRRWDGRLGLHRPNPGSLDVVAAGVAKERAVADLARQLGVPPAAVLAIGNGDNDAGLLAWAGLGVAVANATPALRALAAWVAPDNNSEGVAAALERFVLS